MVRVGILGAAGYTGGELIRLLLNHPGAEIAWAHSESNGGNLVSDVHEGLLGDTDLRFSDVHPYDCVDVVFLCFGHGKSEKFLAGNPVPQGVKIIDLAQDFRIGARHITLDGKGPSDGFVYGLPEMNKAQIQGAERLANPGCFATCIQLGLLPLAHAGLITADVSVNAITGSTGAGQKPGASTHFSWRNNNMSTYKLFSHQHLHEIAQSLNELKPQGAPHVVDTLSEPVGSEGVTIDFIPYRGDFARGIFCTEVIRLDGEHTDNEIAEIYRDFYRQAAFTHYTVRDIDLKQVVNTNKALVSTRLFGRKLVVTSCIDNLLKGAVGQAVQNMNLMFGLDEKTGLGLKASAF